MYLYRVYQNYNIHGRFLRVETWLGARKSAIIIPEPKYGAGWEEIAERIFRHLGNRVCTVTAPVPQTKTYSEAADIQKWPDSAPTSSWTDDNHPLSRSLVGRFNDAFNLSPKSETSQMVHL